MLQERGRATAFTPAGLKTKPKQLSTWLFFPSNLAGLQQEKFSLRNQQPEHCHRSAVTSVSELKML